MIDLTDLMTHIYYMDIEQLDNKTKVLKFLHEPGDYAGEFTINTKEILKLRKNLKRLENLLK